MADVSIEISGGQELERRLRLLPDRIAVNVMVGAMYAGAKVVLAAARKRAPILDLEKWGGPHEPGNLLANIFARRTRARDRNTVGAIVGVGPAAFYARFVEFGTSGSDASSKGHHYRAHHATRPYPFMRPAADESKDDAVAAVAEYAGRRIESEAAKQA